LWRKADVGNRGEIEVTSQAQETVFALDCGATNWRLYRAQYQADGAKVRLLADPQPSPLTSFSERRLSAAILLSAQGDALESFGEVARNQLENENLRGRVREYFKPCIGAHLTPAPLPHQRRYTHAEATTYTRMLLQAVIDEIRQEKWRMGRFDSRVGFACAFPVHWRSDHRGVTFEDFRTLVYGCLPDLDPDQIRFVAEPDGAIYSLQHRGQLSPGERGRFTLITDVGGSTTDIVAGEIDRIDGELSYLGRYGEPLGGGLYDAELAKYIADELSIPASALADDPALLVQLRHVGQRLKESLSRQLLQNPDAAAVPQRTITLVLRTGQVYRKLIQLDPASFSAITHQLDSDFHGIITRGLQAMGVKESSVGQVVLVGGGSQLFTVVRHLRERFGEQAVLLADSPDECVAHGISLEYGVAASRSRPSLIFDTAPTEAAPAPEPPTAWTLVSGSGEAFILLPAVTTIGRDPSNSLHIRGEKISRFHAEIRPAEQGLELVDLGSRNGTYVNDRRLSPHETCPLQAGDRHRFGDQAFVLQMQAATR
jgi:hypothetical protein